MIKHLYYTHYHLVCLLQTLSCNAACYTITVFTFSASLSLALLIFHFVFLYSHNSLSSINPKNGIVAVKPFILSCSKAITRSLSSSLSLAFITFILFCSTAIACTLCSCPQDWAEYDGECLFFGHDRRDFIGAEV